MGSAGFTSEHWNDTAGNPSGGSSFGNGFAISWQNGPLGRHVPGMDGCCVQGRPRKGPGCKPECTRKAPNGAFVEDVIAAAKDRIEYYQDSRFASAANAEAINHLEKALAVLHARTADREKRSVEGTHAE